jgi:hypothetical protein
MFPHNLQTCCTAPFSLSCGTVLAVPFNTFFAHRRGSAGYRTHSSWPRRRAKNGFPEGIRRRAKHGDEQLGLRRPKLVPA